MSVVEGVPVGQDAGESLREESCKIDLTAQLYFQTDD